MGAGAKSLGGGGQLAGPGELGRCRGQRGGAGVGRRTARGGGKCGPGGGSTRGARGRRGVHVISWWG